RRLPSAPIRWPGAPFPQARWTSRSVSFQSAWEDRLATVCILVLDKSAQSEFVFLGLSPCWKEVYAGSHQTSRILHPGGLLCFLRKEAMTESEWRTSEDADALWAYYQRIADARKLRLFAIACCRRGWRWLTSRSLREAVVASEHYADGLITAEELEAARLR